MEDEVALGFDEYGDGHGLEPAVGFEGFEFIELEGAVKSVDGSVFAEEGLLEVSAVVSEEDESSSEGDARGSEESCGLSECDLGGQEGQELEMEAGPVESEVESEGL